METSNLDAELKTLVINMLSVLRGRVHELSENLNGIKNDIETIKKNQSEMKDTLTEMKNCVESTVQWMKLRITSMIWNIRK